MADLILNDLEQWKILPINRLVISTMGFGGSVYIYNFEESSTWSLNQITRTDDKGLERVVGFKFNANLIIIQSNLGDMYDMLGDFVNEDHENNITLSLYPEAGQTNPGNASLTVSPGLEISDWRVNFNIKQDKESVVLTLNIYAMFSKDLFDQASEEFFYQNWSSS